MAAFMLYRSNTERYCAEEIARAAGVPVARVALALGGGDHLVSFAEAVRVGRALAPAQAQAAARRLFSSVLASGRPSQSKGVPLVLSSTLHCTLLAVAIFVATLSLTPTAATLKADDHPEPMRLVFLVTPGPGGGGGGGGLEEPAPPPKLMSEGREKLSSPIPVRRPPPRLAAVKMPPPQRPAPKAPALPADVQPAVVAPIVAAPADPRSRIGVVAQAAAHNESHGPGSGGGTGGGPYRPGSGVDAPRLLREVKADYTEEARQRGLEGDVVLEIVVRRDGSVGGVHVLQGLGAGLNDRATQAVRQWRFAPAQHLGTPVDVVVEVAVEFKLR